MADSAKPHFFRAQDANGRFWWYCRTSSRYFGGWSKLPFGEVF